MAVQKEVTTVEKVVLKVEEEHENKKEKSLQDGFQCIFFHYIGILFNANKDAAVLRKAIKGFETDEKAILDIATNRNRDQRLADVEAYKALFSADLLTDLNEDSSRSFSGTLLALRTKLSDDINKKEPEIQNNQDHQIQKDDESVVSPPYQRYSSNMTYQPRVNILQESEEKIIRIENIEEVKTVESTENKAPSIVQDQYDPKKDAAVLRKAIKGLGTDEKALIKVLTKRNYAQRLEIVEAYKTVYSRDLIVDLKGDCSGKFLTTLLALVRKPIEFFAKEWDYANDEKTIIELLCTIRSNKKLAAALEDDKKIFELCKKKAADNDFKNFLIKLKEVNLEETIDSSFVGAIEDAKILIESEDGLQGTFETRFNELLFTRSYLELQVIFKEYAKVTGLDIEDKIKKEFSGIVMIALLEIVSFIKSKPAYFAQRIFNSHIKNSKTKDRTLIRIIVSRSEIDLENIKEEFEKISGQSLLNFVKKHTSGDYRSTLLSFLSPNTDCSDFSSRNSVYEST